MKTPDEILKYLPQKFPLSATWKKSTKEAVKYAMEQYANQFRNVANIKLDIDTTDVAELYEM